MNHVKQDEPQLLIYNDIHNIRMIEGFLTIPSIFFTYIAQLFSAVVKFVYRIRIFQRNKWTNHILCWQRPFKTFLPYLACFVNGQPKVRSL